MKSSIAALMLAAMLLFVSTTHARADCANPARAEGEIVYNTSYQILQYCDGTNWIAMHGAGSGDGGCVNPVRGEGEVVYNTTYRVLQNCAGNVWRAMGPLAAAGTTEPGWTFLEPGHSGTCGVRLDGSMWCWGRGTEGQLGGDSDESEPQRIGTVDSETLWNDWGDVSANLYHACSIREDGTLWCWGWGSEGRLGNGGTGPQLTPVRTGTSGSSTLWDDWTVVSAGNAHTCGIREDGTAWCWGNGGFGRLGNNSTSQRTTPVRVGTAGTSTLWSDWITISAGDAHTCGIREDGTAWCWGGNNRIGDGSTSERWTPRQVGTSGTGTQWSDWLSLSAGGLHTCGVRENGTAWCWGNGLNGRLGNDDNQTALTPVQVGTSGTGTLWSDWHTVATGGGSSCGIRDDGSAWCWGAGGTGKIGDGNTNITNGTPVRVGTVGTDTLWNDWTFIRPGQSHTCGLREDLTAWCWGGNTLGQIGNGTTDPSTTPAPVNEPPVEAVTVGSCADPEAEEGSLIYNTDYRVMQYCDGEVWVPIGKALSANCELPWGGTLAHADGVTAYETASVPFGESCADETRFCDNGILSGTFEYPSCILGDPDDCTLDGQDVPHGQSHTFYSAEEHANCASVSQERTCTNGTLDGSGSYQYASCEPPESVNEFTQVANLPQSKWGSAAAPLADGRVLICGGATELTTTSGTNRCDVYDPGLNTFTQVANLPESKTDLTAALLADGRVFFCGGRLTSPSSTNRCDIYDPDLNTFTQVANLPQSKFRHTAAPLADGRVLVCGGDTGSGSSKTNRCDIYNPSTNSFSQVANLPQSKWYATAAPLMDGRVLICGGATSSNTNRCDIYDPDLNTFTQVANLPQSKTAHTAAPLADGRVLVCGGDTGSFTDRCDAYDTDENAFIQVADLPQSKAGHFAAPTTNGGILICGGVAGGNRTDRCDIYTP